MPSDPQSFEYGSIPQPAPSKMKQSKYRDHIDGKDRAELTLMSDPRVVRGSTFALARKIAIAKEEEEKEKAKENQPKNETYFSKSAKVNPSSSSSSSSVSKSQPSYHFDVKPYVNPSIDISSYLVEPEDPNRPRPKNIYSQTDVFAKRPPTPEYIPRKTGIDNSTQIEGNGCWGELFDFELEVAPIVEVIVLKTLEQALFEVNSEEELVGLEKEAKRFESDKQQELAWMLQKQQEEIQEQKRHKEVMKELDQKLSEISAVKKMVGGLQFMQQLLSGVVDAINDELYQNNTWRRPEQVFVKEVTLEQAEGEMLRRHNAYLAAQVVVDELLVASQKLYETGPAHVPEQFKSITLRVSIPGQPVEGSEEGGVGPPTRIDIRVDDLDTSESIDKRMRAEMAAQGVNGVEFKSLPFIIKTVGRPVASDACVLNFPQLPSIYDIQL